MTELHTNVQSLTKIIIKLKKMPKMKNRKMTNDWHLTKWNYKNDKMMKWWY